MSEAPPRTLGEVLLKASALGNPQALRMGDLSLPASEVLLRSHRCALALRRRGLTKGDRVALLSENRPEWMIADLGTALSGGVLVPLYMNLLAPQVKAILGQAKPRLAFASTPAQAAKFREASSELEVVLFDPPPGADLPHSWERFLASGAAQDGDPSAEDLAKALSPDDPASTLFTSGTTGEPKPIPLTHRNLTAALEVLPLIGAVPGKEVALSFLPLAHVFGRVVDLGFFAMGASICYAPELDRLPEALRRYRPTAFAAVPRVFEKAYAAVQARIASAPSLLKSMASWILKSREGNPLRDFLAERLFFRKIREGLGGRLRLVISGGAPLSPDILRFFRSAGVPILEGYGLTEAPVLCVNLPGKERAGSVGPPLPGVELRIAEDGEILARGPVVSVACLGPDGWFPTGDLGKVEDGFLSITGRKKELMKTAGGKYIAPAGLEQRLLSIPAVSQAMVVADGRPYPVALLVPDPGVLRKALVDHAPGSELDWMEAQMERVMIDLPRYERVKRVGLLASPFTVESGELTPTLKLKRAAILQKRSADVEAVYARPKEEAP